MPHLHFLVYRKPEALPTSASSTDLAETASLPLVIKEKDVEYQVSRTCLERGHSGVVTGARLLCRKSP